ncbi:hypothetical protein HYFRA_00005810 [Hymenoscyphus fraxineus]|uniref:Inheritance of peroxisomes protein 1 n=1 Tax=Hymenoscyphus fraxineus TaxID=746836 RepID=A0A9N9KTX6_9HELO|nr:hypothetical protein HYFRA_00005810 [Hymenoscyphus fraxineus]
MDPTSKPTARRSVSLPPPRSAINPDPQVEILYNLPSVRIVAFTTSSTAAIRQSSSHESPIIEEQPGTLPWVSRSERTIAIGPLRIYRAPGSVAFLNCQNALQPILPKSQSWCVDGDSKFVLQIRKPQYWRIEVPNKDLEERVRVEELKVVLSKVLLFEKTPCPFQRHFTVELPEPPKEPAVKRPWRPVQGPQPYSAPIYEKKRLEDVSPPTRAASLSGRARPKRNERPPTPSKSPNKPPRISLKSKNSEYLDSPPHSPDFQQPTTPTRPLSPPSTVDFNNSPRPHTPATTVGQDDDSTNGSPTNSVQFEDIPSNDDIESTSRTDSSMLSQKNLDIINEIEPVSEEPAESIPAPETPTNDKAFLEDDDNVSETDDESDTRTSRLQPAFHPLTLDPQSQALKNGVRSTTAPPVISFVTSPPSKKRERSPLRILTTADSSSSHSSSVRSFHSIPSWHSPLDPTSPQSPGPSSASPAYPYPHENIVLPKRAVRVEDDSELSMPRTPGAWESSSSDDESDPKSPQTSPPIKNDSLLTVKPQVETSIPGTKIRHRATTSSNSRRGQLSPLPAAVNLFSPPAARRPRHLQTRRHIPTAILQKTCEILLSPPSHLFQLMISIASKIAAGEWRGVLFSGYGDVTWDFEEDYADGLYSPTDDFGIALPRANLPRRGSRQRPEDIEAGGSWEVD